MFAEDLSVFFDIDGGFAVGALRTPVGGVAEADEQAVVFDANGLNVEEFDVVTQAPSLIVPTSTWATLAEGDEFEIGGTNYRARQVYPSGDGAISVVVLARV